MTLKVKPGTLKRSSALAQLKPRLKGIYQKYYQGQEKGFIGLLELIAASSLDRVEQAIALLEKINPSGISTEKIRTIVERNNFTPKNITSLSDTEANSKKIIDIYAEILKEVSRV